MNRRIVVLELLLLVACCAFFFFYGLGSFGLLGADEPRYAQVAREMLARHDWVTPVLYGEPWLEKPPLLYWRAMVAYSVFGVSDWAARLPSATFAAFLVLFTYFWCWKFRPSIRLYAALMLASSAFMIGFARAASTDMSLAAPFGVSMLCWWGWHGSGHRGWLAAFYFFNALGMLGKGPVAPALAGVVIVAFAFIVRDRSLIWRTLWIPGILLFCAISLPWYVAVQMRNPQFLHVFIFEHNLARFGSNMFRHKQPFWYYIPVALLAVLPWTVLAIAALVNAGRNLRERFRAATQDDDGLSIFLLLWTVIPIVFFSISQSKLPGYILPAIPPLLLLSADYGSRKHEGSEQLPFWLIAAQAALIAVLMAVLFLAPAQLMRAAAPVQATMLAAVVGAFTFFVMAVFMLMRGFRMLRLGTLVAVILAVAFILRELPRYIDVTQSERLVSSAIQAAAPDVKTVATFKARREVEYGVAFYRNQPVKVYERLEIPAGEHLVIASRGSESELREISPGRTITRVGEFTPQKLEFFMVGPK
jgi:4-amino-4-deoxy-L-arabinose transferase-like glycosyltransferase